MFVSAIYVALRSASVNSSLPGEDRTPLRLTPPMPIVLNKATECCLNASMLK